MKENNLLFSLKDSETDTARIYYNLLNILLYLLTYDLKIGAKRPGVNGNQGETTRDQKYILQVQIR